MRKAFIFLALAVLISGCSEEDPTAIAKNWVSENAPTFLQDEDNELLHINTDEIEVNVY